MKATKKRADVLYQVLLKHFKVDQFMVFWSPFNRKMFILGLKDHRTFSLCVNGMQLEFKWATKYLFTKCLGWSRVIASIPTTIGLFHKHLTEISYDFKENRKSLIDVKHELVKQLLSSLRRHLVVEVVPSAIISFSAGYQVYMMDSLEELVIQEELGIEYAKVQQ